MKNNSINFKMNIKSNLKEIEALNGYRVAGFTKTRRRFW